MVRIRSINRKIGSFVFLYLWITYIIYLLLIPLKENTSNLQEWRTVVFLAFASLAFYFGCCKEKINNYRINCVLQKRINDEVILIALVALVSISIMYMRELLANGIATMSLNMGDNYIGRFEAEVSSTSFWGQLNTLLLPARIMLITYCTLFFKLLNKVLRTLFLFFISILIIDSLFKGVQVGVGNIMIYIMVPLFFLMFKENKLKEFRHILLYGLILFVVFFVFTQLSRATAYDVYLSDKYSDNIFYHIFGTRIGSGILNLFSYFSHGYKGLNYSLQLPFEWTYGYGGSRSLNDYLNQYLHFDSMYNVTYPLRVKAVFGYDCEISWPTAFPWWASDFSFPGVVVLMFFLGILVCKVVKEALNNYSVVSISFLCQLVILIIFIPLNNQAFQARDSLIATVFLFFFWLIKRKQHIRS